MAKKSDGVNLSAVIRAFQSKNPSIPATQALEAVRKSHQGRKINEGTLKATFYKLAGGKKKAVRRRKPGRSRRRQSPRSRHESRPYVHSLA